MHTHARTHAESFLAQRFLPLLLGYLEHETEAIVLQEVISILVAVDLSPALKTRVLMFSLSKLGANTEPEIANSVRYTRLAGRWLLGFAWV